MKDKTGWGLKTVDFRMMQYSVYAVLGVDSLSEYREIERYD